VFLLAPHTPLFSSLVALGKSPYITLSLERLGKGMKKQAQDIHNYVRWEFQRRGIWLLLSYVSLNIFLFLLPSYRPNYHCHWNATYPAAKSKMGQIHSREGV
jgi:hypothetical protein